MTSRNDAKALRAAVEIIKAVSECIQEVGEVPAGHLYAQLMGIMNLDTFEGIISTLVEAKVVARDGNHMLRWIGGPK